jgi:hypothetical protein
MSIIQPILTSDQIAEITAYINNYRSLNQAPPLIWDETILNASNQWSEYLLTNNLFQHSGNPNYGENLAYFQGYGTDSMTLLKKAVDAWYNEISSYDFTNPGFSQATGHFTALVWSASTSFAIGITIDINTSAADIVFNSSPPGNIDGQYEDNVKPPIILPPVPPPVPVPTPVPVPSPNPPTPPLPISNSAKILMIINELNNIIFAINKRKPVYFIVRHIQQVIDHLSHVNIDPIKHAVIYSLNGVISVLQKRKYSAFAIATVNNIINQLKLYL